MSIITTIGLFLLTAMAEIAGCYLPYLWLQNRAPAWALLPAIASLALFVWLLTLHPTAAGRVYAAYGGIYVATALAWLWLVGGGARIFGTSQERSWPCWAWLSLCLPRARSCSMTYRRNHHAYR